MTGDGKRETGEAHGTWILERGTWPEGGRECCTLGGMPIQQPDQPRPQGVPDVIDAPPPDIRPVPPPDIQPLPPPDVFPEQLPNSPQPIPPEVR